MVRKGWTHVEVPNGWVQHIRGPRPKAVQWPGASKSTDGKSQQQQPGGQPSKGAKDPQPERVPLHPDERMARARVRVGQLESAIKALDPPDPIVTHLQEALKKAQVQARVPPIESRLKVAEEYLTRKKKRLSEAEEAVAAAIARRDRLRSEVEEGEKSLARLKEEQQRFPHVFAPSAMDISAPATSTLVAEVEQLQTMAQLTERRVDVFFEAASGQSRWEGLFRAVAGRFCADVRRRSCTMDSRPPSRYAGCNVGGERARVGTVVPRGGRCSGPVVQEFPFCGYKYDQMRCSVEVVEGSCVLQESKYGLRGCRVGEASNPGPRVKRRRIVESSSPQSRSDFFEFSRWFGGRLGCSGTHRQDAHHSATQCSPRVYSSRVIASSARNASRWNQCPN